MAENLSFSEEPLDQEQLVNIIDSIENESIKEPEIDDKLIFVGITSDMFVVDIGNNKTKEGKQNIK